MQLDRRRQQYRRHLSYIAYGILILLLSAIPASSLTKSFTITAGISWNVVTDFGAACNGVANDDPAFVAAANAMRADSRVIAGANVTLIVPPGATCNFTSCTASGPVFSGLNDFTWILTGATMTDGGGACGQWGNVGFAFASSTGHQTPPFNTVTAGASCVTMTTPADAGGFSPGNDVIAGAIGTQISSFPPNLGIFEYLVVLSSNSGTGQVCFTTPLVNGYKSTWVDLGSGNCSNVSCGSNGHLYLMDPTWSHTMHVIGGTWFWGGELIWQSKTVVNDNITITSAGQNCYTPTVAKTVTLNNNSYPNCRIEADKEVELLTVNNSTLHEIIFQSSSFHGFAINNSTIDSIIGTAVNTTCNSTTINSGLGFGNAFGSPQSFSGTNCMIASVITGLQGNVVSLANAGSGASTLTFYNGGGNIIQPSFIIPPAAGDTSPPQWYIPGTTMHFSNGHGNDGFQFVVGDNTYNLGTTTLTIATTLTGATLPPLPTVSNLINAVPEILPLWSCSGCTGGVDAIDLAQAGAQNAPIFTYSKRTYTCLNNVPNVVHSLDINSPPTVMALQGNWISVTINVIQADTTGNTPVQLDPGAPFGNLPITNQVTAAQTGWGAVVELTHTGTRVINPTSATGALAGDTLTTPGANSWVSGVGPTPGAAGVVNGTAAQCPVVSVEWKLSR